MKRVLFLLVSAFLASVSFASNVSHNAIAKMTKSDNTTTIGQQEQGLILEMPSTVSLNANGHYSHGSHGSHGSHSSHSSHSSHYSSR